MKSLENLSEIFYRSCISNIRRQPHPTAIMYIFAVLLMLTSSILAANVGKIVGQLVDADSGEPLIGANVMLEGTNLGAATDLDGAFAILNVPAGTYTLYVSYVGYQETRVVDVKVVPEKTVTLALKIKPQTIEGEEVTVEARLVQQTEAAMLSQRRKSESVSDGLSAEAISRSGSGDAAEAMRQVTGASVVGGKYVYVRGLGERYASTQLNGVELPSADPDKRSFNLDLVPTTLLDNIVAIKTFTPDKPGNFSGGVVDLGIRSYPDQMGINFSTGLSYNTQSSLSDNFLSNPGSKMDWLGDSDGNSGLPEVVRNNLGNIPSASAARRNPEMAQRLDLVSKAFTPVMSPTTEQSPLNNNFSFSIGNKLLLGQRPLGYFGSISYSRSYEFYDNGQIGRWKLTGKVAENDSLSRLIELNDTRGVQSVLWGGMASITYQLHPNHEIQGNLIRTQSGISEARYLIGPWPEQNVQNLETRVLSYKKRALNSWQARGKHDFPGLGDIGIKWIAATATSSQDEPDVRFFSDTFSKRQFEGRDTLIYSISPSIITRPSRYFRELDEDSRSFQTDMTVPLKMLGRQSNAVLKLGYFYEEKDRSFSEMLFQYWQGASVRYNGDPTSFFSPENVGIVGYDSTRNTYQFGNYLQESLGGFGGDYSGNQRINAAYLMLDFKPVSWLRLVAGSRFEATRMVVTNASKRGTLNDDDWLPSVNTTVLLRPDMNLRLAYGKTLARPNFREKAPYTSFEFAQDVLFSGNPELKRTLIDNYDVRWEWFPQPGEVVSVSGFYKRFKNPIERTINVGFASEGALVDYENVDHATVYGTELEIRKALSFLSGSLQYFSLASNLSLIKSEVNIPEAELRSLRALDPNASDTRELQGQSPYLVNVSLNYDHPLRGTVASLHYNVFGDRLFEVALGGTPGVYERARHLLNFTFSQKIFRVLKVKFAVKNILDSDNRYTHQYNNHEYIRQLYKSGRNFSFGLQYSIN